MDNHNILPCNVHSYSLITRLLKSVPFKGTLFCCAKLQYSTLIRLNSIAEMRVKAIKSVCKRGAIWETGEAMPETALLLPIAQIFGVTVDELLKGERSENPKSEEEGCGESGDLREEIKRHLFTRGKDEPKHFSEKICWAICGALMLYRRFGRRRF